jgi:hypothetical protein
MDRELARKLLAELQRMPNATSAEALAALRRRLVELGLNKAKGNRGRAAIVAERRQALG